MFLFSPAISVLTFGLEDRSTQKLKGEAAANPRLCKFKIQMRGRGDTMDRSEVDRTEGGFVLWTLEPVHTAQCCQPT